MEIRQIVLDTETTGLYPSGGDRIIEFAGLEMINRRLTGNSKHFYINPQRDIPQEVVKIHGITFEKVQDKPIFEKIAQEIYDFIKDAELIIHNAPFDKSFLNMEFKKVGLPNIEEIADIFDTLVLARQLYPGKKNSLDALCERLSIDKSKRLLHGALIDCDLLAKVYLNMTSSQFTLDMEEGGDYEQKIITPQNLSNRKLKCIHPTDEELDQHKRYLNVLEEENKIISLYNKSNK